MTPKCPLCGTPFETCYSRRLSEQKGHKWFRVVHARHPYTCELRYEDLGFGESPEKAFEDAINNLKQYQK